VENAKPDTTSSPPALPKNSLKTKATSGTSKAEKDPRHHLVSWAGKRLKNGLTVHWKVKVSDEKNEVGDWSPPAIFKVGGKRKLRPVISTSSFECSDPKLNKIFKIHKVELGRRLKRFIAGNHKALGQGIDVQRAAREFLYHYDSAATLWHWVALIHAEQNEAGLFPATPGTKAYGAGNSDAGVLVPHTTWWMTGDQEPIKAGWRKMDRYMVARERADLTFRGRAWETPLFAEPENGKSTSPDFVDLCYFGLSTRIMKELASPATQPLNTIRFKNFSAQIQHSFKNQHLSSLQESSLSANLLALRSSVIPKEDRQSILSKLLPRLTEAPEVSTLGISQLFPVLSLTGNSQLIYSFFDETSKIDWNKKNLQNTGSGVSSWMISGIAGIDALSPGFQRVRIAPQIDKEMRVTQASASINTPMGEISSSWKKTDKALTLNCTIPAGTLGIVTLPKRKDETITETGKSPKEAYGVETIKEQDGQIQLIIQSGTYQFEIK